jgi:hypothetical protein
MRLYGVVALPLDEAIELFRLREDAEAVVSAWDKDEPNRAGELRVDPIDFVTGTEN